MPAARGVKRNASKSSSATTSSSAPKNKKKRAAPFQLEIPTLPTKKACVLTCGQGDVGQLGLGEDVLETTKFKYVSALGDKIVAACAGGMHTIALDSDGKVWTFGCNDEGALGRPTSSETDEFTPASVELPAKAVAISAGDSHSAALLEDGSVYAWGSFRDSHGSMGLIARGRTGKSCREPVRVTLPDPAAALASGGDHLVMLTTSGAVYTMGCGEQGQLGRLSQRSATRDARQGFSALLSPLRVSLKGPVSRVWAGYHGTFAQGGAGLYAWGLNNYHQLGVGGSPPPALQFLPAHWPDMEPRAVAPGQHHTLVVDAHGGLHALGRCDYGRLGLGAGCGDAVSLTAVPKLADQRCISVAAGTSSSFAVTDNGYVYSWGMGSEGLLGVGGAAEGGAAEGGAADLWEPLPAPTAPYRARAVAAGGQHTVLLAEDPSKAKSPTPEPEKEMEVEKTEDKKVKDKKQDEVKDKPKVTKRQRTASKTEDDEVSSTTTAEGDKPEKKQKLNGKDKKETPMEVDETDSKQPESKNETEDKAKEKQDQEPAKKDVPEPMEDEPIPETEDKAKQTIEDKEDKPTEPKDKQQSTDKPKEKIDEVTDKIVEAKTIDTEMKEAKPEMNGAVEEATNKVEKQAEVTEKVAEKEEKLDKTDATLPPATATA